MEKYLEDLEVRNWREQDYNNKSNLSKSNRNRKKKKKE